jgi:hypothetical protein
MSTGKTNTGFEPEGDSSVRVRRLMRRVRTEVSVCEVAAFSLGKAWSILLIVAAVFFVIADKWAKGAQRSAGR